MCNLYLSEQNSYLICVVHVLECHLLTADFATLSLVFVWQCIQPWLDLTGGLTGFNVAKDLMKLDFSPPKEAPEEFRALTFSAPPMVKGQGRPALLASQIYHQGIPPPPADCNFHGFGFVNRFCAP